MSHAYSLSALALAAALAATGPSGASAGPGGKTNTARMALTITVNSDYGNGTVTAPVRRSRYGYQVRLPGGLWYDCEVSCHYTLRRESVDFWQTRMENGGDGYD